MPQLRQMWFPLAILAGLVLMGVGAFQMRATVGPTQVVEQFLNAFRDGDRAAAVSLLAEPQLSLARRHTDERWHASPRLRFRIQDVKVVEDFATIIAEIRDDSAFFQPHFKLVKIDNQWRISEVSQAKLAERRDADQIERMTRQLEDAARALNPQISPLPDSRK